MIELKKSEQERLVYRSRIPELEHIMRESLKNNYFKMAYQPLVSFNTGQLIGFESLIMCEFPRFGVVGPDEFIPHVEQSGMILELGDWIFEQVMLNLSYMLNAGFQSIRVSLNISPVQILNSNAFLKVMNVLDKYSIPPTAIKIKLTETALINGPEKIARVFEDFHREGAKV